MKKKRAGDDKLTLVLNFSRWGDAMQRSDGPSLVAFFAIRRKVMVKSKSCPQIKEKIEKYKI